MNMLPATVLLAVVAATVLKDSDAVSMAYIYYYFYISIHTTLPKTSQVSNDYHAISYHRYGPQHF